MWQFNRVVSPDIRKGANRRTAIGDDPETIKLESGLKLLGEEVTDDWKRAYPVFSRKLWDKDKTQIPMLHTLLGEA